MSPSTDLHPCCERGDCLICQLSEPDADLSILGDRIAVAMEADDVEELEPTDYAVEPRQRLGRNGVQR